MEGQSKKILISINARNLNEIIDNLKLEKSYSDAIFTFEVEMLDEKSNYEYLINSNKVLNWEIIN